MQAEVDDLADQVRALAEEHASDAFQWAQDESERRRLWEVRHRALDANRALRPGAEVLTTDVCVPVSRLAACVVETQYDVEDAGLIAPLAGHVGDGNFHLAILIDPRDPAERDRAEAFYERLVRRAIEMDGTCSGEHDIGLKKAHFLEEEHGAGGLALMRAIKGALDPEGPLNPGKSFA
jgi:D-lactate dehydrogenase (cytochrome)